mmetsp:Transcript_27364/g.76064  ORF Transcript_27364/g.76064 Transcript_27364/m.76064 type:complete len:300 (+) Transcript_27364:93-992(+)
MVFLKRAEPIGWDDTAFQLWDRMPVWAPLNLPCIPLLGKYGPEYVPAVPFVVVRIPSGSSASFPPAVFEALAASSGGFDAEALTLLLLVHPALRLDAQPCNKLKCGRTDEFNLMLHPWAFPDVTDLEAIHDATLSVGAFPLASVEPAHLDDARSLGALAYAGAPFGELQRRQVLVHFGCLSPDNLQLRARREGRLCAFFSAASKAPRAVVALHILPVDEAAEDVLRRAVRNAPDAAALRTALASGAAELGEEAVGEAMASLLDALISSGDAAEYAASLIEQPLLQPSASSTSGVLGWFP